MAGSLMQSLADLQNMLDDMSKVEAMNRMSEEDESENSEYCIKNGAYVRIADDGMSAWIYLNPPKKSEKFYSRSTIVEFINQHNVVKGLHESNISAIAKKHVYEREILIARGADPKPGIDGYYEYFFDTSDKKQPTIKPDGMVDYSSMSQLTNVNKGDLLAEYHPLVPAESGYDVYGNEISIKPARDLPPLRGRGIVTKDNTRLYYADVSGRVEYKEGRVDIKEIYEILGDVDLVTGKVEFFGDIHITGNVGAGVLIRASRNVTIDGVVEAAQIFAGGDVSIRRGIKGAQRGSIAARGDVCSDFIEFATVHAGGSIRSNSFVNSTVYAGGTVTAEGKKGIILGGSAHGLLGVSANDIGNDMEVKTRIEAGYSEEDYQKYRDITHSEKELKEEISKVADRLFELIRDKRLHRQVDNEAVDKELVELTDKKDALFEKADKLRNEKEELEEIFEKGRGTNITVNNKIYRGATLCIEGAVTHIMNNTSFTKYKKEGGEITSTVIVI